MEPTFLPTPIPFTPNAKPAILSSNVFDGYWARKDPWLDGSTVLDQRTGLGTPRPPEPRRCLEFNGTDQYGWIPIDPVTEFPFTLFGWARIQNTNPALIPSIFGISALSGQSTYYTFRASNNTLRLTRSNTSFVSTDHSLISDNNLWYSYVVVFTSSTEAQVYRNGVLVHTFTGMTAVDVGSAFNRFVVGSLHNVGSTYFNGLAMHCGFLRRAATLADAQTFHTTGIIPDAEVLLPLDGNSTTVAHNIGTSAAHWLDEPRRNLAQYTEDATNSYWRTVGSTVVLSGETPPTGVSKAFRVQETAVDSEHRWENHTSVFSVQSGSTYTITLFAKAQERTRLRLGFDNFGNIPGRAFFDLSAGTVYNTAAGTTASIQDAGNGWYRCRVTATATSTVTTRLEVALVNTETTVIYLGDGVSGLLLTAPQFEFGSTASDYQPVLGSGIDYPEATIVNGAAGMLYEGRDVPFSRQNEVGFSPAYMQDMTLVRDTPVGVVADIEFDIFSTETDQFVVLAPQPNNGRYVLLAVVGDTSPNINSPSGATTFVDGVQFTGTRDQLHALITDGSIHHIEILNFDFTAVSWANIYFGGYASGVWRNANTTITNLKINGVPYYGPQRVPALNNDTDAIGSPLTYTGKAHFDGALEQSNCLTFDGVDDYISMDLADVAIMSEIMTNSDNETAVTTGPLDTLSGFSAKDRSTDYAQSGTYSTKLTSTAGSSTHYWRLYTVPADSAVLLTGFVYVPVGATAGQSIRAMDTADGSAIVTLTSTTGTWVPFKFARSAKGSSWPLALGQNVPGDWGTNSIYFDNISLKLLPTITHDGTSLLTYRPEGDGISGTAGTAYNIRLGDVEHIPCSEGAGDFVHGTKLNQAYPIVNGQASNWEDKQDGYHYNIKEGAIKIDTSDSSLYDPSTLVYSDEASIGIDPSDFTHLFQDHRGTIPVTQVGDPIGLAIDKQYGGLNNLGPEFNTNPGDPFTVTTGYGPVGSSFEFSIESSRLRVVYTADPTSTSHHVQRIQSGLVVGKTYKITVRLNKGTTERIEMLSWGGLVKPNDIIDTSGDVTRTYIITATDTQLVARFYPRDASGGEAATGVYFDFIELSVKELPGNHLSQTDSAKRPILARTPEGGVRSLQTFTEDFENVAWNKSNSSVVGKFLFDNATSNQHYINNSTGLANATGQTEVFTVWGKPGTFSWMALFIDGVSAWFNLSSGTLGTVQSGLAASIALDADGFYRCRITRTRANALTTARIYVADADNSLIYLGDGTGSIELQKSQLELNSGTPYQKVTTRYDITESGKRDCWGIGFNGTNQCLSTAASVDMTGSDEMTVCVGVRKLTDAATGYIAEFSETSSVNNGTFYLVHSALTQTNYQSRSRGDISTFATINNVEAPSSNTILFDAKISVDRNRIIEGGVTLTSNNGDQGSGEFGNYRLFIGARNETSNFLNGIIYQMTIINRLLTDWEQKRVQNFAAYKTGLANPFTLEPKYIPASQTNPGEDALGNPLTHPAVVGVNAAETEVNFSPVDNSWPEQYSIPGADLPNYTFDGDPGDISLGIDTATREASFHLRTQ